MRALSCYSHKLSRFYPHHTPPSKTLKPYKSHTVYLLDLSAAASKMSKTPPTASLRRSTRQSVEKSRLAVQSVQEPSPPPEPSNRRSKRKNEASAAQTSPSAAENRRSPKNAENGEVVNALLAEGVEKQTPLPKKKKKLTVERAEVVEDSFGAADEIGGGDDEWNEEPHVLEKHVCPKQRKGVSARVPKEKGENEEKDGSDDDCFLGDPVPEDEARERWPHRYPEKSVGAEAFSKQQEDETVVKAKCHYLQARVDSYVYHLNDDAYVKAGEGEPHYIGHIVEFFETCNQELYFTAQWFFRAEDTVIKEHSCHHDTRRVFLSDEKNDNTLSCIMRKVRILRVPPRVGFHVKEKEIPGHELFYDMSFSVAYSSFACLTPAEDVRMYEGGISSGLTASNPSKVSDDISAQIITDRMSSDSEESTTGKKNELSLLDLYSGCGAMSTGLCLGAKMAGVNLKTCWAIDMNRHACDSLKLNHPETEVRNEKAEDFFAVIREWETLCQKYDVENESSFSPMDGSDDDDNYKEHTKVPRGEFEVGKIVGICYGKTENIDEVGLKFKVRWKGYGPSDDTWEPLDGLSKCQNRIQDFVRRGYKRNILPLPGTVDVICGGPPCQGISGFNRFRQKEDPFKDEKNKQMAVFIEIVEFLKPKFVLMENVVDILRFAGGCLGRYALSKLVAMNYQARLGILAAGNYGLPQYRMRVFLWGAHSCQKLPQFPLPTHDVVMRGAPPVEFEANVVAYDGGQQQQLEKALLLYDAIADLPPVENDESRYEMSYGGPPETDFQHYIRRNEEEMMQPSSAIKKPAKNRKLFDHRPLQLNDDDHQRVCRIPKSKGANFRDLPGVIVGPDNTVQWDPNIERVLLPSGKPLIPDYAMSFKFGKSSKPFGRLWWDETVPTVVTRAQPHNQIIIHPEQDRVLTVRENARLQGFPDYYRLSGPVKERYIQVGNAVAIPVSRALGYAFGIAYLGKADDEHALVLPPKFPLNI